MSLKAKTVLCSVGIWLMASTALYAADTTINEAQHSVHVRYTDLNLNRGADVARLYRRLSIAARSVCGPRDFAGYRTPGYDGCVADTIRQAVTAVDSAALSAFYEGEISIAQGSGEVAQSR
jgi:UrcA family protein